MSAPSRASLICGACGHEWTAHDDSGCARGMCRCDEPCPDPLPAVSAPEPLSAERLRIIERDAHVMAGAQDGFTVDSYRICAARALELVAEVDRLWAITEAAERLADEVDRWLIAKRDAHRDEDDTRPVSIAQVAYLRECEWAIWTAANDPKFGVRAALADPVRLPDRQASLEEVARHAAALLAADEEGEPWPPQAAADLRVALAAVRLPEPRPIGTAWEQMDTILRKDK